MKPSFLLLSSHENGRVVMPCNAFRLKREFPSFMHTLFFFFLPHLLTLVMPSRYETNKNRASDSQCSSFCYCQQPIFPIDESYREGPFFFLKIFWVNVTVVMIESTLIWLLPEASQLLHAHY